jgi:hypothetical protein
MKAGRLRVLGFWLLSCTGSDGVICESHNNDFSMGRKVGPFPLDEENGQNGLCCCGSNDSSAVPLGSRTGVRGSSVCTRVCGGRAHRGGMRGWLVRGFEIVEAGGGRAGERKRKAAAALCKSNHHGSS